MGKRSYGTRNNSPSAIATARNISQIKTKSYGFSSNSRDVTAKFKNGYINEIPGYYSFDKNDQKRLHRILESHINKINKAAGYGLGEMIYPNTSNGGTYSISRNTGYFSKETYMELDSYGNVTFYPKAKHSKEFNAALDEALSMLKDPEAGVYKKPTKKKRH